MAPAAARYRLVVVARAVFLATFLSAAATAATEASACADESTLVASLRRVQATMEDPFGVLQRSWVDPSKLCGGRPAGVMGSDANGGWWGVTCDAEDPPCVKKLYLAGKSFRGEVRAVLAAVADAVGSSVEYLHLGSNRLTAPLPGPPLPLPLPLPPAPGAEVGMGMAEASSVAANDANNAIFGFQAWDDSISVYINFPFFNANIKNNIIIIVYK